MSILRQESEAERRLLVRTLALNFGDGGGVSHHDHIWPQLIFASQGVMEVHTVSDSWIVPPQRAVWVPADLEHRLVMRGPVSLRTLYLRPTMLRHAPNGCQAVNVAPFLRELILHMVGLGSLRRDLAPHRRLAGVLLDQLGGLEQIPLQLPRPRDERACRAADLLWQDPGLVVEEVARKAGASRRTLERKFRAETGMTLGRWRQQLRLLVATHRLALGESVTQVALGVGYESPSAFIAMFRRVLGVTPSRFLSPGPLRQR